MYFSSVLKIIQHYLQQTLLSSCPKNWRLYTNIFLFSQVEYTNTCLFSDVLFESIWNLIFAPLNFAILIDSHNKGHVDVKGFTVITSIQTFQVQETMVHCVSGQLSAPMHPEDQHAYSHKQIMMCTLSRDHPHIKHCIARLSISFTPECNSKILLEHTLPMTVAIFQPQVPLQFATLKHKICHNRLLTSVTQ